MALKVVPIWVYANHTHSQLGVSCFVQNKKSFHLLSNCRPKWESFGVKPRFQVEDKRLMSLNLSDLGTSSTDERIDESPITEFKVLYKDLDSLPKPLSAKDLVAPSIDRANVRVAYQGSPGAYSETAALKAYPICKTVPCDRIESVFKAVELRLVDKGILPIENSVGGSIHQNYDLLLHHRLHIAFEQCEITLNKLGTVRVSTKDDADAAKIVALEGVRENGAIASLRAAEIYKLDVLEQTIQDDADNITRFLIIAREAVIARTHIPHKTSIVFTLEEGPEVLFKALAVFALRDINLLKIESRPQRKRPLRLVDNSNKAHIYFEYLFYVDFEASMADPPAQSALSHLQKFCTFLRVLGCYPVNTAL